MVRVAQRGTFALAVLISFGGVVKSWISEVPTSRSVLAILIASHFPAAVVVRTPQILTTSASTLMRTRASSSVSRRLRASVRCLMAVLVACQASRDAEPLGHSSSPW